MNLNRLLHVEGVSKAYGSHKALDGVSLSVDAGEFVALLGPNGAGKTTLFQLLTGLFVADGGRIRVDGQDTRHRLVAALAGLGVVFQQPALDLDLTVRGNLRFHARLHGLGGRAADARMQEELSRLGLAAEADRLCRTLSGGNRRKVELARALLHQPRLLLMDEPTVGLDPGSRGALRDYVSALCRDRGVGVLWATHLVDEAERADRVLVLHGGHLVGEGTPAELLDKTGKPTLAEAFIQLTDGEADRHSSTAPRAR
ncbi:MAG TPA: ABC transporter ATP-binding protein [Candidatus Methylomirabilis sp.]|nr:ABC transporter ATP-binding protein [Candidatus Methylomirabilis sp.]